MTETAKPVPGNPFLGEVEEICIVTPDVERTATGLLRTGIGPWRILELNPQNCVEQTYRGKPVPFSIRIAFAQSGRVIFELMQPLDNHSIFAEHLKTKGEGLHHVAFDMNGIPWEARIKAFEDRGFALVQSGRWIGGGGVRFAFFDTEQALGACFESYLYPPNAVEPTDNVRWFPAPPTS